MKFEEFKELLKEDRTIRRFDNSREINEDTLRRLVELTRYCASGRNAQPLRYRMVTSHEECSEVYPLLKWAGYYTDWDGPEESQRPAAYLIQWLDKDIAANPLCDDGLQLQAITLGARSLGIGGCIIKSFNAPALADVLDINKEKYELRYVLALGYPAEIPLLVDMETGGDFKYFRRAEDGQHCVPKRGLDELLV